MVTAYGEVEKGGLRMDNSALFWESLKLFEGMRIVVEVKRHVGTRSRPQNAFYWASIVKGMSETTGYTPEECHEILKSKCNSASDYIYNEKTGVYEEITHSASTTRLTPKEFADYIDKCTAWLGELGIFIESAPSVPEAWQAGQGHQEEPGVPAEAQDEGGRTGVQHDYEEG